MEDYSKLKLNGIDKKKAKKFGKGKPKAATVGGGISGRGRINPSSEGGSKKRSWKYHDIDDDEDDEINDFRLDNDDRDVENRAAFTPGWNKHMHHKEGLPIKVGGKVVKTYREEVSEERDANEDSDDTEDGESNKSDGGDDEDSVDSYDYESEKPKKDRRPSSASPQQSIPEQEKAFRNIGEAKYYIGSTCSGITANPEKALTKRRKTDDDHEKEYPRVSDLLDLLTHTNEKIVEMTMLSLLLVFKDICPTYRIRLEDVDIQLKKDTKKRRDIDKNLLDCYRKFITFLEIKVKSGLGDVKKKIVDWNEEELFGLSAYRCQCELIRYLYHFNFRSVVLKSVISRGSQPNEEISKICMDSVDYIFKMDTEGEVTFEVVKSISQHLIALKYDVDERYISILEKVKLATHENDSNEIRKQAKAMRKKRKKASDDVETSLMESDAVYKTSRKRFQLDCLHEICLIYFRIIKQKVGYQLFPAALEGMGRVAHLVNIDTMEDLVVLLKTYLPTSVNMPVLVKLNCVLCGLRTLSGPGVELQMDAGPFIDALFELLFTLDTKFSRWDVVLNCIDCGFLKRRESRPDVVPAFVRHLFFAATQVEASIAVAVLATAHSLLIRYPSVRNRIYALTPAGFGKKSQEEDMRVDIAMDNLRSESGSNNIYENGIDCGDASWSLSLLRQHPDIRFKRILSALMSRDVVPVPVNLTSASINHDIMLEKFVTSIDNAFSIVNVNSSNNNKNKNKNNGSSSKLVEGSGDARGSDRSGIDNEVARRSSVYNDGRPPKRKMRKGKGKGGGKRKGERK